MKDLLVGSTGFVGNNLMNSHTFEGVCHSSDIVEYFDSNPKLCLYAGVPAAMYLANADAEADLAVMKGAIANLNRIQPEKVVLISSIAVYLDSRGCNELSEMETQGLSAYGCNRLQLERWVREEFPNSLIVRLPALYGIGLKKNFLYDMHTITPAMLKPFLWEDLAIKSNLVRDGYTLTNNGFYTLNGKIDPNEMKAFFETNDFNALSFTDSRSSYQFYNLSRLWNDIENAISEELTLLNLTTPPISAACIYKEVTGKSDWLNELERKPFDYDLRSVHFDLLGGKDGYLCTEQEEIADICRFMEEWK